MRKATKKQHLAVLFSLGAVFFFSPSLFGKTNRKVKESLAKQAEKKKRYVFLLSIDGFAHKHLLDQRLPLKQLRRYASAGVTGRSQTIFPSMTWSSHASMVTGQHPRRHGILGNRWLHRDRKVYWPYWEAADRDRRSEAIYEIAAKSGIQTAALMWPGTQGAKDIAYNLPEVAKPILFQRYLDQRIRDIAARAGYPKKRLHAVMQREDLTADRLVTKMAVTLIRQKKDRPQLFLLHFLELDRVLHQDARCRHLCKKTLAALDHYFGEIVKATQEEGIFEQSTFFIASDHGFLQIKKAIDLRQILVSAGISRYTGLSAARIQKEEVTSFYNGHSAFVYIHPRHKEKAVRQKRRRVLKEKIIALLKRYPEIQRVYRARELRSLGLPKRGEHPGAPDLVVLAKPDSFFLLNPWGKPIRPYRVGMHGYLPHHPSMRVPFLAFGASIRDLPKAVSVHNLDLAPTIAHLFGLSWSSKPAGRVLFEILKKGMPRPVSDPLLAGHTKREEKTKTP